MNLRNLSLSTLAFLVASHAGAVASDAAKMPLTLADQVGPIVSLAYSSDGKVLITGSHDRSVRVSESASGKLVRAMQADDEVHRVAISGDGRLVAAGTGGFVRGRPVYGKVFVWELASGKELFKFTGHLYEINSLAFSPDGQRLASSCGTHVKIFDLAQGKEILSLLKEDDVHHAYSLAYSPDGKLLATAGGDRTVRLWNAMTGEPVNILKGHTAHVWRVAFSADGKRLVSCAGDSGDRRRPGQVRVWAPDNGKEIFAFEVAAGPAEGLALSADGKLLAVGMNRLDKRGYFEAGDVRLFDLATGKLVRSWTAHARRMNDLAFHPDSTQLATCGQFDAKVWSLKK